MPARAAILIAAATFASAACSGDRATGDHPAGPAVALERAIAADLGARIHAGVYVRCAVFLGTPVACTAVLPDRSALRVGLHDAGSAWDWSIPGRLVAAAPIEAYVTDVVRDLGAPQSVACGPALRPLPADERVTCRLEHGGAAFVAVGSDGRLGVEVELDPKAAAARDEPVTHIEDTELDGLSRTLAPGSGDE